MYLDKYPSEYKRIATAATHAIKATSGILRGIVINEPLAGTLTIKDGTTIVAVFPAATPAGEVLNHPCGIWIQGALSVVTTAADKVTILFK